MSQPIRLHEAARGLARPRYVRPMLVEGCWPSTPSHVSSITLEACHCLPYNRGGKPGGVCSDCGNAIPGPGEPGYVELACIECGAEAVYRYVAKTDSKLVILLCGVHAPQDGGGEWLTPRNNLLRIRADSDDRVPSAACLAGEHDDCLGYGVSPSRTQATRCPCDCGHAGAER
jgi:hypothetical protein